MPWLRVVLMTEMAKVLGHGRVPLAQSQGKPLVEIVMGSNTMGNGLGVAQKDVATNFRNQSSTS